MVVQQCQEHNSGQERAKPGRKLQKTSTSLPMLCSSCPNEYKIKICKGDISSCRCMTVCFVILFIFMFFKKDSEKNKMKTKEKRELWWPQAWKPDANHSSSVQKGPNMSCFPEVDSRRLSKIHVLGPQHRCPEPTFPGRKDEGICFFQRRFWVKWKALSCPTLCHPMHYTVLWFLQAIILEWVVFPFSRGSSPPRGRTQVSCLAGGFFTS